jgi:hypothetical protein
MLVMMGLSDGLIHLLPEPLAAVDSGIICRLAKHVESGLVCQSSVCLIAVVRRRVIHSDMNL